VPQDAPQCRDLHGKVVLLDIQTGPDAVEQFLFAQQPTATFEKRQQHLDGALSDANRHAAFQQLALGCTDFETVESVGLTQA
jgi:hypothetical protein